MISVVVISSFGFECGCFDLAFVFGCGLLV